MKRGGWILCILLPLVISWGCDEMTTSGPIARVVNNKILASYCMNDDISGGGWLLVARTGPTTGGGFGWNSTSTSDWTQSQVSYSLGLIQYLSSDLVAYEFLFVGGTNSVATDAVFGNNTLVFYLALDNQTSILNLTSSATHGNISTVWRGSTLPPCTVTPNMVTWIGFVLNEGFFFTRDNKDPWPVGLNSQTWWLYYSNNCQMDGLLTGKSGSIWTRLKALRPVPSNSSDVASSISTSLSVEPEDVSSEPVKSESLNIAFPIIIALLGLLVIVLIVFIVIQRWRQKPAVSPSVTTLELSRIPPNRETIVREKSIALLSDVTINEKIGQGHFGFVYRGTWAKTDVALKAINKEDSTLHSEAAVLQDLNHPNIVRFFGLYLSHEDAKTYMVMEYMRDGSLETYVRSHSELTWTNLLEISLDAIAGMRYLNDKKIVHRDLALRNLLVQVESSDNFIVKVSDFGLSQLENLYGVRNADAVMPIKWSAPEVLRFNQYSAKSDIWAMGVVLWELFTYGEVPYRNLPNLDVIQHVLSNHRLPPPSYCPSQIYDVMSSCWSEVARERPSWDELYASLEEIKEISAEFQPRLKLSEKRGNNKEVIYGNTPSLN